MTRMVRQGAVLALGLTLGLPVAVRAQDQAPTDCPRREPEQ